MKRKLFSIFASSCIALSCVLSASAYIYTPGDAQAFAGKEGVEYILGVYGAYRLGGFDPLSLNPLQWINGLNDGVDTLYNKIVVTGTQYLNLNGTSDFITTPVITGNFQTITLEFSNSVEWGGANTWEAPIGGVSGGTMYLMSGDVFPATGETLSIYSGAGISYIKDTIAVGTHTLILEWTTDRYEFTLDGTPLTTYKDSTPAILSGIALQLGKRSTVGNYFNGGLYNFKIESSSADLVEYDFQDIDSANVPDVSGGGNAGTITTTDLLGMIKPSPRNLLMKQSACLKFNGTGDYIILPSSANSLLDGDCELYIHFKTPATNTDAYLSMAFVGGVSRFGVRIQASGALHVIGADSGGGYVSTSTGATLATSTEYEVKHSRSGNVGTIQIKGGAWSSWTTLKDDLVAYPISVTVIKLSTSGAYFAGYYYNYRINTALHYPMDETYGNICYDVSGNGHHGTIASTALATMRAGRQDVVHRNMTEGFSLYQHASTADLLVPYGDDGNPLTITPPSGYTRSYNCDPIGEDRAHNFCETLLQQPSGAESDLGHVGLYYEADGTTEKQVSGADLLAYISGTDNCWINITTDANGEPVMTAQLIFAETLSLTYSQWSNMNALYPNTAGAGTIEPLYASDGLLYDSNGDVIFVQP